VYSGECMVVEVVRFDVGEKRIRGREAVCSYHLFWSFVLARANYKSREPSRKKR
jgi:hypothetical protein